MTLYTSLININYSMLYDRSSEIQADIGYFEISMTRAVQVRFDESFLVHMSIDTSLSLVE